MAVSDSLDQNDFATEKVSEQSTTSGWHLALIIVGGTIGFSVFLVSAQIGGALGYRDAALAFGIGSLVLGVFGAATSYVGAKSRLSTYVLSEFAFGRVGAKISNLAIGLSLVGWYGVISNFLGQATKTLILDLTGLSVSVYVTVCLASFLMIFVTVRGFKGIDRLSLYLVPLMTVFIGYAAYASLVKHGMPDLAEGNGMFTFKTAVSAVIGGYIAGVIIQPDYSRFAVNTRHAIWGVFAALGIIFPLVQFFSALPSMVMGQSDLLAVLLALGLMIPSFLLLFLSSWCSNVLCLYSSALSLATLWTSARLSHIILGIGIFGTALAFVPAQDYLVNYLVILGVAFPPIGTIYILEVGVYRRFAIDPDDLPNEPAFNIPALIAWALAIAAGYLSQEGILSLFGIASIDSLIVSSVSFILLRSLWVRGFAARAKQMG